VLAKSALHHPVIHLSFSTIITHTLEHLGIPMGLTAGFKILDKDRDKSKDFDKDHYKQNGKKEKIVDEDAFGNPPFDDPDYPLSGWTSMVEDYLCHNGGSVRTALPSTADVGFPMPLSRRKSSKEPRKGPYQLLIKERLMGIYMAIYVHRDLKPLVRGRHLVLLHYKINLKRLYPRDVQICRCCWAYWRSSGQ